MNSVLKTLAYACMCVLMFPVDLLHWTLDAWRFTLEAFSHRIVHKQNEQPCIYCQGLDHGLIPRRMCKQIPYWNLWMVKMLVPHLEFSKSSGQLRPMIVCQNDSGYTENRFYYPVIAIGTLIVWAVVITVALFYFDILPQEYQDAFFLSFG